MANNIENIVASFKKDEFGKENKNAAKNTIITIIIVVLIMIAAVWIWKTIQISTIKKNAQAEKQLLQENANKKLKDTNERYLKVLARPFVWAVRKEMLNNNMGQVSLYVNDMVKEKNFQKIVILNEKGLVLLSTNKKEEGKQIDAKAYVANIAADSTTLGYINDSLIAMSSPIMGFNNRLGTLLLTYSVQPSVLK